MNTSRLGQTAGKEGHHDGQAGRPAGQGGLQVKSPRGKQLEQSQAEIPGRIG